MYPNPIPVSRKKKGRASKRSIAALCIMLSLVMTISLTGCGKSSNPPSGSTSGSAVDDTDNQQLFVQSYLNLLCKQDFKSYANACGFEVSEVEESYDSVLDNVIDIFLTYNLSDSAAKKFREALKEIFGHCKYEVQKSVINEDGTCSVDVKVQKLVVFKKALKKANKDFDKWVKKQPEDADEEKLTDQFIDYVIQYCKEELKQPEYKEEKTITIVLTPSADDPNVYQYNSEDLGNLQAALLDFGAWDKDVEDEEVKKG